MFTLTNTVDAFCHQLVYNPRQPVLLSDIFPRTRLILSYLSFRQLVMHLDNRHNVSSVFVQITTSYEFFGSRKWLELLYFARDLNVSTLQALGC
jgi:hypothetical protein